MAKFKYNVKVWDVMSPMDQLHHRDGMKYLMVFKVKASKTVYLGTHALDPEERIGFTDDNCKLLGVIQMPKNWVAQGAVPFHGLMDRAVTIANRELHK